RTRSLLWTVTTIQGTGTGLSAARLAVACNDLNCGARDSLAEILQSARRAERLCARQQIWQTHPAQKPLIDIGRSHGWTAAGGSTERRYDRTVSAAGWANPVCDSATITRKRGRLVKWRRGPAHHHNFAPRSAGGGVVPERFVST